jgi:hypothetical protein
MPKATERARGGAIRYRTITRGRGKNKRVIHIAIIPKSGSRGGHTVAGPARKVKGT